MGGVQFGWVVGEFTAFANPLRRRAGIGYFANTASPAKAASKPVIRNSPAHARNYALQFVVRALGLSRDVMKNIRQTLFFAFIYNAVGLPLAAGLLYPFTGWLLNPMVDWVEMALSSVSVVGNALRLRHRA